MAHCTSHVQRWKSIIRCTMTSEALRFICDRKKEEGEQPIDDWPMKENQSSQQKFFLRFSFSGKRIKKERERKETDGYCPPFPLLFIFNLKFQFEFKSKWNGSQQQTIPFSCNDVEFCCTEYIYVGESFVVADALCACLRCRIVCWMGHAFAFMLILPCSIQYGFSCLWTQPIY